MVGWWAAMRSGVVVGSNTSNRTRLAPPTRAAVSMVAPPMWENGHTIG